MWLMLGLYMKMHQWGVTTAEFKEAAMSKMFGVFFFVSARHSGFAKQLRQKTQTV